MKRLYKQISTPGLSYRRQVVDNDGLPEIALTLFAHDLEKSLSESSVPLYIREIISIANWASTDRVGFGPGLDHLRQTTGCARTGARVSDGGCALQGYGTG